MAKNTQIEKRYLGNGVYASFDGFRIILSLQQNSATRIALDPEVFDALLAFKGAIMARLVKASAFATEPVAAGGSDG